MVLQVSVNINKENEPSRISNKYTLCGPSSCLSQVVWKSCYMFIVCRTIASLVRNSTVQLHASGSTVNGLYDFGLNYVTSDTNTVLVSNLSLRHQHLANLSAATIFSMLDRWVIEGIKQNSKTTSSTALAASLENFATLSSLKIQRSIENKSVRKSKTHDGDNVSHSNPIFRTRK